MAKLKKVETVGGGVYAWEIFCPGCKDTHALRMKQQRGQEGCWDFNGDHDKPTFDPSLKVRGYCGPEMPNGVCHSWIKNGKIIFLPDSTHELAGQTVDLPDHDTLSRKG